MRESERERERGREGERDKERVVRERGWGEGERNESGIRGILHFLFRIESF